MDKDQVERLIEAIESGKVPVQKMEVHDPEAIKELQDQNHRIEMTMVDHKHRATRLMYMTEQTALVARINMIYISLVGLGIVSSFWFRGTIIHGVFSILQPVILVCLLTWMIRVIRARARLEKMFFESRIPSSKVKWRLRRKRIKNFFKKLFRWNGKKLSSI